LKHNKRKPNILRNNPKSLWFHQFQKIFYQNNKNDQPIQSIPNKQKI
jgi:hypothetical protein